MFQSIFSDYSPFALEGIVPGCTDTYGRRPAVTLGMEIKVLLADDHPVIRGNIKQCINENAGMVVVGEAGTAQEVFAFLAQSSCDVLVLDIALPDRSGIEVLRILKMIHPALPVLILTQFPEDQFSRNCLNAGAAGFLHKENAAGHLVDAIWAVTRAGRGGITVPGGENTPSGALPH